MEGYAFWWDHHSKAPYLITPDRKSRIICDVDHSVPYISPHKLKIVPNYPTAAAAEKQGAEHDCGVKVSGNPLPEVHIPTKTDAEHKAAEWKPADTVPVQARTSETTLLKDTKFE